MNCSIGGWRPGEEKKKGHVAETVRGIETAGCHLVKQKDKIYYCVRSDLL
jgi:hypothetical protein